MKKFLQLLFGNHIFSINSLIIKFILILKGIKVGKNFYITGTPYLKIRGIPSNIKIGNNVKIYGDIDLRNRENGKIFLRDNVTIEDNCRIVSAREGLISIDEGSIICAYSIINGGHDVSIGKNCIIGRNTSINSNSHITKKNQNIRDQGFDLSPVTIEDDCWTGINSVITKGVRLKKGSIIGANSVVTKDTEENSINVGSPSIKIKFRD